MPRPCSSRCRSRLVLDRTAPAPRPRRSRPRSGGTRRAMPRCRGAPPGSSPRPCRARSGTAPDRSGTGHRPCRRTGSRRPRRDHPAVDVGADRHDVGLDIGVLGRDVAAAHRIPVQADEPRERAARRPAAAAGAAAPPPPAGSWRALRPGSALPLSCTGALPSAPSLPCPTQLPLLVDAQQIGFDHQQAVEQLLALRALVHAVERLGAQSAGERRSARISACTSPVR